ncbi:MAG: twin-arginine translocase TatA/TatE family subunit [bacterium]|nr:twin-arginine translocase TatA/TatE family subunit [bacterium]
MHIGWQEVIVIALVVLLLFGGSAKLPDLARSLGKALKEFKKALKEVQSDDDDTERPAGPPHA